MQMLLLLAAASAEACKLWYNENRWIWFMLAAVATTTTTTLLAPMTNNEPSSDCRGLDDSSGSSTPFPIALLGALMLWLHWPGERKQCRCCVLYLSFSHYLTIAYLARSLSHAAQSRQIWWCWCCCCCCCCCCCYHYNGRQMFWTSQTTERYQLQVLNYLRTTIFG